MTKRAKLYRGNIAYDEPQRTSDTVPTQKHWSIYARYMYSKGRKIDDEILDTATERRLPNTDDSSTS